MSRPSLLSRLYLLLGVLGVGFLLLAAYLHTTTEGIFTRELRKELTGDLELIADLCRRDPGLLKGERADSLARAVSRYKGYRVTIITADGRVVGESHVAPEALSRIEDHSTRPEIVEARRDTAHNGRRLGQSYRTSPTVKLRMWYVAKSLGPNDPTIRLAAGPATLDDFRAVARRTALLAFLLFILAAGVIALWVSRRISLPLLRLRVEARDVSKPLRWDAPFREAEILNDAFTEYADAVQNLAAELRVQRDRLLELLDRLEEGVVLLDKWGRIRALNASARTLLPLKQNLGQVTGLYFRDAVRHEGLARWATEIRPSSGGEGGGTNGGAREGVYQVDKQDTGGPNDSPVDLLCHLRVVQPEGAEEEILLTLVDVTGFRNLDRAKTDFVANASHELKTPLSSILGYSETLLDGALEDPRARGPFLQKIHANARRLQGLVQDLLNLSQLESAETAPHAEPLFVRDFVQAAWNNHRIVAESQGLRFENRVPLDLKWRMEPRDLDLMVGNLVGNAVKYNSPAGKVRVDWDEDTRTLGVRDTGAGIPAEALPRIFERFYRGGGARATNEGTGLGLAIVKHAAQRYGIAVAAQSAMGEGSRFTLEVPEALVEQAGRG
jgi:two-component system phosphate regulon sensor histidine kinase PhoR